MCVRVPACSERGEPSAARHFSYAHYMVCCIYFCTQIDNTLGTSEPKYIGEIRTTHYNTHYNCDFVGPTPVLGCYIFMIGYRLQKSWMLDWWPVIFPGAITLLIGMWAFQVVPYEILYLYDSNIAYMISYGRLFK